MALNETQKLRMNLVAGAIGVAFLAVLGRLYQIQCLDHRTYENLARKQHLTRIPIPVHRGTIFDSSGSALAICLPVDSVYADPAGVKEKSKAAWKLAPVLGMQPQDVFGELIHDSRFVWLKRRMALDERPKIDRLRIKGIGFIREFRRGYPQGTLLGHTLGFVGIDNNGLEGLELTLDKFLSGEPGYDIAQRDAAGTPISMPELKRNPGVNGLDVHLTIDGNVQRIAEEELKKAGDEWRPIGGVAVVMNPQNGDILALANWPPFNPNSFADMSPEELKKLSHNSAVLDAYEPGSTFKPITVSGALDDNIVNENTLFDCEDGTAVLLGGRRLRDTHGYGVQPMSQVVIRSSNIGMGKLGMMVGKANLYRYVRSFGFGRSTGLPLQGESPGLFNPPSRWSKYTITSVPMGQEVSVTAVQIVAGFSAIANGGNLMKPRLIKKVVNPDANEVVAEFGPEVVRRVISEQTARRVTAILVGVVEDEHGTGRRAQIPGYAVAGKTGTAQKALESARGYSDSDYTSSFVGYAPAGNPRVCVLVKIDTPRAGSSHYGGTVAAPPVREIIRRTLAYMGVPPDPSRVAKTDSTESGSSGD